MMIHPIEDEILEKLWELKEEKKVATDAATLELPLERADVEAALVDLQRAGAVRNGESIELLSPGEERGRAIVRRHRLAEILFTEVLDVDLHDAEQSACELEHTLSERVVDRVCTFLGHPPKCPHGRSIPQGSCCRSFERKVDPLITRLNDLAIGSSGRIVFISPRHAARLNRLASLGVIPGTDVRLMQRRPSIVIGCGETSIAIESDVASEIWVRPGEERLKSKS